jgi:peptidoglycan/LPS O-acetylase OafA/YrhL
MSTRPAIHLGNLSYAIYVLHIPVLVLDPWPRLAQDYGPWPAAAACALALLVVAHVAHIAIELPARRAIVRAYERRDAAAAARAAGLPTS